MAEVFFYEGDNGEQGPDDKAPRPPVIHDDVHEGELVAGDGGETPTPRPPIAQTN